MDAINLEATLETKISKNGREYQVIVIKLSDRYNKMVFLEPAEKEILRARLEKENDNFPNFE